METNEYVLALLKSYHYIKQEANMLQYELEHFNKDRSEAIIESMNFSSNVGDHVQSGNISDQVPDIALKYQERTLRDNEQALCGLMERLEFYKRTLNRLEFFVSKLEPKYTTVIKSHV